MNNTELYNALLIDDESDVFLPILKSAANSDKFYFFHQTRVIDGIGFLKDYHSVIDVIVLDFKFPNDKMQGVRGLEIIKKLYPSIPVIIVSETDKAKDDQAVIQCMKAGAYAFISKMNLNPDILIQTLINAVNNYTEHAYSEEVLEGRRKEVREKMIPYVNYPSSSYSPEKAVFGFKLSSIMNETFDASNQNLLWHQDLLKVINTSLKDVALRVKYSVQSGSLSCFLFVAVIKKNKINFEKRIDDTLYDIQNYLYKTIDVYAFSVLNENEISFYYENDSAPKGFNYHLFYRPTLPLAIPSEESKTFADLGIELNTINPVQIISDLPSPNKTLSLNDEIFQAFRYQSWAEIEINIEPKTFSIDEIERLNGLYAEITGGDKAIKGEKQPIAVLVEATANPHQDDNTEVLIQASSLAAEGEMYKLQLENFLTSLHEKFKISLILKREGKQSNRDFKIKLAHYFFGRNNSVNVFTTDNYDAIIQKEKDLEYYNSTTFLYDYYSALQVFRLPPFGIDYQIGIGSHSEKYFFQPNNLPQKGVLLGVKKGLFEDIDIRLSSSSLTRHLYVMGQTGTGKSTLLKTMIGDCIQKGQGFALLDPHGDLYDDVYHSLNRTQRQQVVFLDTTQPNASSTFNPLIYESGQAYTKSLIVNELLRSFLTLYGGNWNYFGPSFESMMRNVLLLIMDDGNPDTPVLSDVKRFFHDKQFRNKLLANCRDMEIKGFFEQSANWSGDQDFENWAMYIVSKLNRFIDDYFLRNILCPADNSKQIKFREIIDNNKILMIKMDKGLIGSDNASLLGQLIIGNLIVAAMSRSDLEKGKRNQYLLFIDEFQNFIKSDISSALSEVRKYGLSLIMANQTMTQLSDDIQDALMGNAGSMIFFRPGINDYQKINHYLEPEFKREDILKLPNFNCIARLLIDNIPSDPFVFQTKYVLS